MRVYNIKWDCPKKDRTALPTEIEVPDHLYDSHDPYLEEISDYLSDKYGFCHLGFDCDEPEKLPPRLKSMSFTLVMDRPIKPDHYIMPGGYSINDKIFDFQCSNCTKGTSDNEYICEVDTILEDYSDNITPEDAKNYPFDEFFVYTGEKKEDPEIHPVQVKDLELTFNDCIIIPSNKLMEQTNLSLTDGHN